MDSKNIVLNVNGIEVIYNHVILVLKGVSLQVAEGSPLLLVERVTFTYGQKPVEWRRGFYSTRNHHYHNELG